MIQTPPPPAHVESHHAYPKHELLGSRVLDNNGSGTRWNNTLDLQEIPWLSDYTILGQITFSPAVYISLAVEAIRRLSIDEPESITLKDVSITSALLLQAEERVDTQTTLRPAESTIERGEWYEFEIATYDGNNWVERCVGKAGVGGVLDPTHLDVFGQKRTPRKDVPPLYWYHVLSDNGLEYGPAFRRLDEISTSLTEHNSVATVLQLQDTRGYIIHPVTLDQCFQVLLLAACKGQGRHIGAIRIVTDIQHLVISCGSWETLKLAGRISKNGLDNLTGDISGISEDGSPALSLKGCKSSVITNGRSKSEEKLFSFTKWETGAIRNVLNGALPAKPPKRVTLVVPGYHHPVADSIEATFRGAGIACDRCKFESDMPQSQDIISLLDFGNPYLYDMTEARFRTLANRLSNFKGSMLWVTKSTQITCQDPNVAMILGLARTFRAELRLDVTVVEIDDDGTTYTNSSQSLLQIYQGLGHRQRSKTIDPDYEYAIVDGDIKVPRLHWTTGKEELERCVDHLTGNNSRYQTPELSNGNLLTPIYFRSDASYLLVGGLGGLGRVVATWMVENGARNLLFLSRSAMEGPGTTPFFDGLRVQGCTVSTFAGSVTSLPDVQAAVAQATKPIAGVIQMSAVMRDNWMSQMTFTEWDECTRPKVDGTWNLHHATSTAELDFFLLFSSICGVTGQWGQANYNAANSFLDAFVRYRHGQNLPASVVDIGFMGAVGMAMENSALVDKLKKAGYYFLGEQELIDALIVAITYSRPNATDRLMNKSQVILGLRSTKPITSPASRVVWKKDARMVLSHQFGALGAVTDDEAKESIRLAYQGGKFHR